MYGISLGIDIVRTEHWKECEMLSPSPVTVAVECISTGASTIYTINDPCPCEHLDTPRSLFAYEVQAADLLLYGILSLQMRCIDWSSP